jgi:hypothetical protein
MVMAFHIAVALYLAALWFVCIYVVRVLMLPPAGEIASYIVVSGVWSVVAYTIVLLPLLLMFFASLEREPGMALRHRAIAAQDITLRA